ncbi:MAG: hypothetical protein OEY17_05655 [Nitrosopumilus sp.]|nr:hypothetical protein [Nitrosopumilus sp.]MDH5658808.1 hypothetical protein [Nitrosopumilus sp.]
MSLEAKVKQIVANFESTPSGDFLETLEQIKPFFRNPLISEYLQGKIQKAQDAESEMEKKKQCKDLMPYLDWYLQGL